MLRRAEFMAWLESMGLNPSDVAEIRFVPEGARGISPASPVRLEVTTYCQNEQGKRYFIERPILSGDGALVERRQQVATETRMVDCPSPPTAGYAALLGIQRTLAQYEEEHPPVEPDIDGVPCLNDELSQLNVLLREGPLLLDADPERVARRFHETYERLAPQYGYQTRPESAVPWEQVPDDNRRLMAAVVAEILPVFQRPATALDDVGYRALLNAVVCVNPVPWSVQVDAALRAVLDPEAHRRGYADWVAAFHQHEPTTLEDQPPIETADDPLAGSPGGDGI